MILSHKIQLDPTIKQRGYFARASGTARMTWNWGLAEWSRQYEAGEKPTANNLKKQFNATKYEIYPWMTNIHRDAHSQPFANLGKAWTRFFNGIARKPNFKKKGKCKDSFYVANEEIKVAEKCVRFPIIGWVRMCESIRFAGKIMAASVSRTADRWFVSFQVDIGDYRRERPGDGILGVDLGLTTNATLSTGEKIQSPKPLRNLLTKLQRLSRQLSRKVKGSARRFKAAMKVARLHARIVNLRKNFLHVLTTRLCRENQAVGIESLNVKGMVRNRKLARSVSDAGFGEFARQMGYKSPIFGTRLVIADQWFPSSKRCSACGTVKKTLSLSERTFHCESCGFTLDRDHNAALNLEQLCTPGLGGIDARGHEDRCMVVLRNEGASPVVEAGTKPCSLMNTF